MDPAESQSDLEAEQSMDSHGGLECYMHPNYFTPSQSDNGSDTEDAKQFQHSSVSSNDNDTDNDVNRLVCSNDTDSNVNLDSDEDVLSLESDSGSDSFLESDRESESLLEFHSDSEDDSNGTSSDADPELPNTLSEKEKQAFNMLSVFVKHNLSGSASKDIISMMKKLFPESEFMSEVTHEYLWSICGDTDFKEFHYCVLCDKIFPPEDLNSFRCGTRMCNGLRYKGNEEKQTVKGRQPQRSFILADTKKQLIDLLQISGKLFVLLI